VHRNSVARGLLGQVRFRIHRIRGPVHLAGRIIEELVGVAEGVVAVAGGERLFSHAPPLMVRQPKWRIGIHPTELIRVTRYRADPCYALSQRWRITLR
jgi:hypothetical protein